MSPVRIMFGVVLTAACFGTTVTASEPAHVGYLVRSGDTLLLYADQADRDAGSGGDCIQLLPMEDVASSDMLAALALMPAQRVSVHGDLKTTEDWGDDVPFIRTAGFEVQRERCGGRWMWASKITAQRGE